MGWLALIPAVLQMIGLVEKIFGNSTGALKKSTVMDMAQTVVNGVASVSTGGQKETWEAIAPQVGVFVDAAVAVANVAGWKGIVDDNFENMKNGL